MLRSLTIFLFIVLTIKTQEVSVEAADDADSMPTDAESATRGNKITSLGRWLSIYDIFYNPKGLHPPEGSSNLLHQMNLMENQINLAQMLMEESDRLSAIIREKIQRFLVEDSRFKTSSSALLKTTGGMTANLLQTFWLKQNGCTIRDLDRYRRMIVKFNYPTIQILLNRNWQKQAVHCWDRLKLPLFNVFKWLSQRTDEVLLELSQSEALDQLNIIEFNSLQNKFQILAEDIGKIMWRLHPLDSIYFEDQNPSANSLRKKFDALYDEVIQTPCERVIDLTRRLDLGGFFQTIGQVSKTPYFVRNCQKSRDALMKLKLCLHVRGDLRLRETAYTIYRGMHG